MAETAAPESPRPSARERNEICAALILDDVKNGASKIGVFTDEELTALDGVAHEQMVPMPWLESSRETVDPSTAAAIAMRGLLARRFVVPAELMRESWADLDEDDGVLYAVDPVQGILTLRRTASRLLTLQRLVSEQRHTIVQYLFDGHDAVLEEEISADGYHHFFILPYDDAVDHALALIDQDEVAGEDSEPTVTTMRALQDGEETASLLADTRALTSALLIDRTNPPELITFFATSSSLAVTTPVADYRPEDADNLDQEVAFSRVSTETARRLVRELIVGDEA